MDIGRDFAKLTEKLKKSKLLDIPLKTRNTEEEVFSYGLVSKALSYINQSQLESSLHLIVSELFLNAEKASLKKMYYRADGIEATEDDEEEAENRKRFFKEFSENPVAVKALAKKAKSLFTLRLQVREEGLDLYVVNAGAPTPSEDRLIKERYKWGQSLENLNEIPGPSLRTGEGDGVGLIIAMIALRKAGISPENLMYMVQDNRTIFRVFIPRSVPTQELLDKVEHELLSEVESLPSFPDKIRKMMEMCESEHSSAKQVSEEIAKDPAVAGQIIKLANSGGFAGGNITELTEAVKIIGLKNISGLLLNLGTFRILEERYSISAELREHHIKVAVYAKTLARKFKLAAIADTAYLAGLLHDIGKIVFLATMKDGKQFESLSARRDRRTQINMEELSRGISHAALGGMLARKWKFPDSLCSAIEFHHQPNDAEAEVRKLVYITYLANAVDDFLEDRLSFYCIEPEVLALFNLTNPDSFEMLASSITSAYVTQGADEVAS